MAELLIRIIDKTDADPKVGATLSKAGDVICVCEDGHQWSDLELKNDAWRIVKVDLPVDKINALRKVSVDGSGKANGFRSSHLNLSMLPDAEKYDYVDRLIFGLDSVIELATKAVEDAIVLKVGK